MAEIPEAAAASTEAEKGVMVVGLDESEHSYYALEWTLRHFFPSSGPSAFKLVVVHAKPSAGSVVALSGPVASADVLPYIESDLRNIAAGIVQKAKEMCLSKSVDDALVEVVEGDARNVLCDAVEKHHAEMLVVGSHGYGAFKRVVLGSVSDYCAHHAHCTVMIVKKPKSKH